MRRLNVEISKLFADATFNAKFIASQGLIADEATGASPEEFEKYIKSELEEFAKLMKLTGLKPQ